MSGRYDELRPDQAEAIHKGIAGSELVIFESSSHTPFHEERESFMSRVNSFLDRVEARTSEPSA
jgi:pimeloyl-ACP methyl ester carboxylesterase